MKKIVKYNVTEHPIPKVSTYIGECCREWVLAAGFARGGKCGLCGEIPRFKRWDRKEEDE